MGAYETDSRDVYTVTRLVAEARDLLESHFPMIWVQGEVSNLSRPASGHIYFSVKDPSSQVRCAMFRPRNRLLSFEPRDGLQVLLRGRVSLYPARGDFQLVVEHMEEAGEGALRLAFEALKRRLAAEGLFDEAHKQPPPNYPRRIGVITSPTGAALRDILHVLGRRFPLASVLVYPVPVQGEEAAGAITASLTLAGDRAECDVLLLARGGGSLEDLWAFNEESVARAIHACPLPVVTGIGHETDFSIADFVADLRAPTPSAAAESVTPDRGALTRPLQHLGEQMERRTAGELRRRRREFDQLTARLQHPRRRLEELAQGLDNLGLRLTHSLHRTLSERRQRLATAGMRLAQQAPRRRLSEAKGKTSALESRLKHAWQTYLTARRSRLTELVRALGTLGPTATLERGYAIVTDETGRILREASSVAVGKGVKARLARGSLECRVEATHTEEPEGR